MARTPKPWYWRERRSWFVTIRGERQNLGPDKKEAYQAFHVLMGKPPEEPRVRGDAVVAFIDRFLESLQKSGAAEDTYVWYQSRLQCFARRYPALRVGTLKPFHVQEWIDSFVDLSSGSKRNYARAIMRCMRWAEEQGMIDRSPIAHFKKPKGGVRETVIAPEEYADILACARNRPFRDLCTFAWEAGARAAECMAVEKRHVDLGNHRIVFPVEEEKMQRIPRIIYLTDAAEEIIRRLMLLYPTGPLFRGANGPWTANAVNCAFVAIQVRMGLRAMKEDGFTLSEEDIKAKIATLGQEREFGRRKVKKSKAELREEAMRKLRKAAACTRARKHCLTEFRHSFCHRLLKAGVDALTVSVLMGHADPTMIAKVYSHLSHAPDYLREVLRKSG